MKVLVTGGAGFIGFHLANRLLERGDEVWGIDSMNDYYDVNLKYARLAEAGIDKNLLTYNKAIGSKKYAAYQFMPLTLEDKAAIDQLFTEQKFDVVCNLAAQAGVRYSIENPSAYISSNIVGFSHVLEACRHTGVKHLVYASSSSVYGLNQSMPFSTHDNVDHPISLYAATKKSNELMAHTYSHLFNLPTTGLRFFTVYGPWGRPDMALFLFTKAIHHNEPIDVYNHGNMMRDFTYIDDIVEGIVRVIDSPPSGNPEWKGLEPDPASSPAPYKIFNIGNSNPVKLMDFITAIEKFTGKKAIKQLMPIKQGDVPATWADVNDLKNELNYQPSTPIDRGVKAFVEWFQDYYPQQ